MSHLHTYDSQRQKRRLDMTNRLTFQDGCPDNFTMTYPVTEKNWPPAAGSGLVDPRIGKRNGLFAPSFPGDSNFEKELAEVVAVRMSVLRGEMPKWFFERYNIQAELTPVIAREAQFTADLLGVSLAEGLADLVRMDSPTDLGRILIRHLAGEGVKLNDPVDHVGFIETHVQTLDIVGKVVHAALEAAFEAKYFFGRPRPGAVMIEREPALAAEVFAQYNWPYHPAYPAGHGAAAGATLAALIHVFDLTDEQELMALNSCAQFAMARTHAGMHYANDNIAGMILGYETAESLLSCGE